MNSGSKVLIPGISGKLGRLVACKLLDRGYQVAGIDRRPWPNAPEAVMVHEVDIRKRRAEEAFRSFRPDAVVHMATVTHLQRQTEDRFKINLYGTQAVFEHCAQYGVKRCIFVGRHTYYGAAADAPLYHDESDPPMAVTTFPELADLVAADLYAGSALWRLPKLETVVLRGCYTLGPELHGTLAAYLRGRYVPTVLGFDPLFQFMHEHDMAEAICLALEKCDRGVYNVAGPAPLPVSSLIKCAGRRAVAIPEPVFRFAMGRFGLPRLPPGAVSHLKFPVVVDDGPFRKATGFVPEHDEQATIAAYRTASPAR